MPDLSRPLAECLEAMDQRRDLHEVLRRYPADRDELVALLRLSVDLNALDAPVADPAFRLRARNRMLAVAAQRRQVASRRWFQSLSRPTARLAVAAAFAVAVIVAGVGAAASTNSLPGDPLYGVKLGIERVQLAATSDPTARARLQLQFADVRLEEAQRLFALGRQQQAVQLVSQYDAAVAQFSRSVSASVLDDRTVSELSRLVQERQAQADARLNALAGSLSQRGDNQDAAAITRTQSHVDQALTGSKNNLQARSNQKSAGQDGRAAQPAGPEH